MIREWVVTIFELMKLILATQNPNKVKEIKAALPSDWTVTTAVEAGIHEELPETGDSLEFNALQKADYLFEKLAESALSDDSGLEVSALNGAPGVYSARFGGPEKKDDVNRAALLRAMEGVEDRRARFRTVLAWVGPHGKATFEGEVWGQILHEECGDGGFGYDSLFVPDDGDGRSFAEMSFDEKKSMSHRSRAIRAWLNAL